MQPTYTDVLIQWLMFFALVGAILIPALMFRKIAVRYNKKGWVFFLLGLVAGFLSLAVGRLVLLLIITIQPDARQFGITLTVTMMVVAYAIVVTFVTLLREKLSRS